MADVTELLIGTAKGDPEALQRLYALLYPEIKRVARIRLAQSGHAAGLNTTAPRKAIVAYDPQVEIFINVLDL